MPGVLVLFRKTLIACSCTGISLCHISGSCLNYIVAIQSKICLFHSHAVAVLECLRADVILESLVFYRDSFTEEQISNIKKHIDSVNYADYIYCMIYLGFRPSEFLALDISDYDKKNHYFRAGAKTEAGINRVVTISPKILPVINRIAESKDSGAFFGDKEGKHFNLQYFTESCFYPALESCGIENPIVEISGGVKRHKYTPHSCRHTFATLMKRVEGPSKDKQELIGHSSEEQLKYYQDVEIADLRRTTDLI